MNEPITRREEKPAPFGAPRTPFQIPAVDRDPVGPQGSGAGADGAEAASIWGKIFNVAKDVLF